MKKTLCIAIAAMMFGGIAITSCKKYDDGPMLSIHSKKARVAGDWEVEKYLEDGVDKTSDYRAGVSSETYTYKKDGSYTISVTSSIGTFSDAGTWEFIDKKEQLKSTSSSSSSSADTMQIVRLTNKEMWLKSVSGSPVEEYQLKAK